MLREGFTGFEFWLLRHPLKVRGFPLIQVNHREDLVSKRSPRHGVIASDLFNTLAAIQVFLGKTAEAEKTIQQGFDFEPDSTIYSLQDARHDLEITDERVLQDFPPKSP
ncbi:hypothetical protein [Endozoicomonas sp. 2B-B]